MTQGIAFFDFDDTLARGDSILPFLLYCIRKRIAPHRQLIKAAGAFLYWKLRPSRASRAKSATLSFLKGRSADEMLDVARAFFRDEYLPRFYQDGLTELWSLRSQGMKLVVVSASPDVYMRALPEFMPLDAVLSTRCEVGGDGRYTGQVGENCKGEEKVRRIEQYLKENGFVLDMKCSSAYGDSPSDADMMALVNRAVLVNPKKALLRRRPDGIVVHWTSHDKQKGELHIMMRLQKFLALSGVASRRNSEKLIADGHVAVNGKVITEMGVQVDESADVVTVDGKVCKIQEEKHYLAYNKPMGEVTTVADPEGRPTVMDKFRDYPVRLYPVGRLDYDSEGLLLLTNDGDLMNNLLHPSREVSKEYLVKVSNRVTDEEIRRLRAGVRLDDDRMTSPADVHLVRYETFASVLLVTIHEGRNRQVRRMFSAIGHEVVALKRVGFATIKLHDLPRGQWRRLTDVEVRKLKEL